MEEEIDHTIYTMMFYFISQLTQWLTVGYCRMTYNALLPGLRNTIPAHTPLSKLHKVITVIESPVVFAWLTVCSKYIRVTKFGTAGQMH